MADTNTQDIEIKQPTQEVGGSSSSLPGVMQSAVSAGAGALSNMYGAGVMATQHPYNPVFDILAHGTGIETIDNVLGKIRPLTPMPDAPKFVYDNPITHTLQDAQKAYDYNAKTYPGETLGSMVEKAVNTSKAAFSENKGETGKDVAMAGLAPIAQKFANEDWAKAGDYLSNEIVKGVVQFAPIVLSAASGVGVAPTLAYMGLSAAGAAENEGRQRHLPVAKREAYALSEGVMNPLVWHYIPKGLQVFANKLAASMGIKMASTVLKESIRDTLSKQVSDLANNHDVQNFITMRASQLSSQLIQHVFDIQRRTIKQALQEMVQQGVIDAITLGLIHQTASYTKNIKDTYESGRKLSLQELLALDETITGIKEGFQDVTGKKITAPNVVDGSLVRLQAVVKKLLDQGNYTDNPKALSYINSLSEAIKQKHVDTEKQKGFLRIKGLDDVKQPLEKGQIYASPLLEKIYEKMPNKATKEQVEALLREVPEEEIEFTGVRDFLKGKEKITKQELTDFVKANQIQIKEVEKGTPQKLEFDEAKNAEGRYWISKGKERILIQEIKNNGKYRVHSPGGLVDLESSFEAAKNTAEKVFNNIKKPDTKFQQYQLPGGENYREVLLTLPSRDINQEVKRFAEKNKINNIEEAFKRFAEENKRYPKANPGELQDFRSSHFDEHNILAHVRINDRQTDLGKTLFVEEVQSDWHQKGRESGYAGRSASVRPREVGDGRTVYEVLDANGNVFSEENTRATAELVAAKSPQLAGVPDAPFKKTWHELAMKRVLKMALDGKYDAVAWTTGEQQAERYDLSKQINKIDWVKHKDGTVSFDTETKQGVNINKQRISKQELADTLGKEVAQKIEDNTGYHESDKHGAHGTLDNLDLKVGGEGMKTFYDQIIPNSVNKMVKKFGGRAQEAKLSGAYKIPRSTERMSPSEAQNGLKKSYEKVSVNAVDIKPIRQQLAMKDKMKGLMGQGGFVDIGKSGQTKLDEYLAKKAGASEDYVVNRPIEVKLEGSDKGVAKSLRSEYVGIKNEQKARGNQLAEDVKAMVPKKLDRQGLFWLKAAEGQTSVLTEALNDPKFSGYHEQIKQALEVAKDPHAMEALRKIEKYYDQSGKIGLDTGSLKTIRENYQARLYEPKPPKDFVATELNKGLRQTTGHSKQRVYNTEFDAVKNGEKFASTDIADNMQIHNEEMARVNTSRKLADYMANSKIASWVGHEDTAPRNWVKVGMSKEGKELYAPKEIAGGMKAITDPDFTNRIDALRNIKRFQGLVKTVDLSLSFFHHITLAAQALYQGNIKGLVGAPHLDTALRSPEFKKLELDFVRNEGEVSSINANADIMRSLSQKQGDGLDKLTQLPVMKQYLKMAENSSGWLFGKYQRYLKVMDYGKKISNWVASHPNATNEQATEAKKGFSREINSAYGGQNWEALGVDKSTKSLLQLTLLAPDWVISNLKLPAAALTDWKTTEGAAARASLVTGIAGGIAATAFLNQIMSGHGLDKNKKGHKFEIEIAPDVYFSLLRGAPGEVTKLYGMMIDSGGMKGINRYAQGKLSPLLSKMMGSLENVKYSNIPIVGAKRKKETDAQYAVRGTLAYAAYWAGLFPVPFGVSGEFNYLKNEPKKTVVGAVSTGVGLARYAAQSKKKSKADGLGLDIGKEIDKELSKYFKGKDE